MENQWKRKDWDLMLILGVERQQSITFCLENVTHPYVVGRRVIAANETSKAFPSSEVSTMF